MNNFSLRTSRITSMALCTMLSTPLLADQYVVNSSYDPDVGDPANCQSGSTQCTLRDALAAADVDAQMDTVIFDVKDTIYLRKALKATQPLVIDGGGNTRIRIDQSYNIALLPDRPFFGDGEVAVLQPAYFSPHGGLQAMLEVSGSGSVVENLDFDGSITPGDADLGVERIDFDSSDTTDFYLFSVEAGDPANGSRWLVAGGISVTGSAIIRNNRLNHLQNNGITVDYSTSSVIQNNVISGGAGVIDGFAADGISFFASIGSNVSGNTVSMYRTAVAFNYCSGLVISNNLLRSNQRGVEFNDVGIEYGEVLVTENEITNNLKTGILVSASQGAHFMGNEVNWNLQVGIHVKGAGDLQMRDNDINHNGSNGLEHGGVLVNEGSGFVHFHANQVSQNQGYGIVVDSSIGNELGNNDIMKNRGAGLVLLGGAQWNQLVSNNIQKNEIGILSGLEESLVFPANNLIQSNVLKKNNLIDAFDYELVCNDAWVANTIGSSASVSAGCIEP